MEDIKMKLVKRNNDWAFPTVWEDFIGKDLFDFPRVFATGTTVPAVNIAENETDYTVEVAAPGMKKNDFKINLERNVLTISSEKEEKNAVNENNYTRKEFSYQSFERSFTLPESVDQEKISANYSDGVLVIKLPKRDEAKPKPIKIIDIS